ncbi:MAG: hypothetical protein R3B70_26065 [Polyangiaceae bacterium]
MAVWAACILTVLWSGIALAQPQPPNRRQTDYRLEFHALEDPTCPPEKTFRDAVLAICGHDDALNPQGRHTLRVVVRKRQYYESTIERFLPDGSLDSSATMTHRATTCAQVMREAATSVAIAIPLERKAADAAGDSEPSPSACDEECHKRVEEAERAAFERGHAEGQAKGRREGRAEGRAERESEIREEIRQVVIEQWRALGLPSDGSPRHARRMPTPLPFAVSASGLISIGFALDVAPGFALGAEWRPIENFSLGVEARAVLPAVGVYYGGVVPQEVSIYSALVSPCARISYFVGCGALDMGGVYAPRPSRPEPWAFRLAAGPRIGADFPFAERFSVRVLGDLLFPLVPIGFFETDFGGEFVNPVVSGFVSAGLTVGF